MVTVVRVGERRFEGKAVEVHPWGRWKLRGDRMTAPMSAALLRNEVTTSGYRAPLVSSIHPLALMRNHLLFYTSPRHNVRYICLSLDFVTSGSFEGYKIKTKLTEIRHSKFSQMQV